jgi:hypothetical protein
MTYPGFQAHQAAQRATDAALRADFQTRQADSLRAAQWSTDAGLRAGRRYQRARGRRGASTPSARAAAGSAAIRAVGRFIRFVITLAIVLAGLGILALVLKQAEPSLYHQAVSWLGHRL